MLENVGESSGEWGSANGSVQAATMVYAFLIHTLTPGPCRLLYSSVFVHEPTVSITNTMCTCSLHVMYRIKGLICGGGDLCFRRPCYKMFRYSIDLL